MGNGGEDVAGKREEMKVENAFTLWVEIYKVVTSKVHTITVIQVAVFAGWYILCGQEHNKIAFGLVLYWMVIMACMLAMVRVDVVAMNGFRARYESAYVLPNLGAGVIKHQGQRLAWVTMGLVFASNVVLLFYECACLLGNVWECKL